MNQIKISIFWVALGTCALVLGATQGIAQKREKLPIAGVRVGSMIGNTTLNQNAGYLGRAYFRHSFARQFYGELDLGYGKIGGDLYSTRLIPLEYRFVIVPQPNISHAPYVYVGLGATNYEIQNRPVRANRSSPNAGWAGHLPLGLGLSVMVDELAALEFSTGYNFSFTDDLDAINKGRSDGFWTIEVGIGIVGERDEDPDQDGVKTKEEATLGTNPRNPDTDDDRISDGDEVHKYRSDPLRADTDADGLVDSDEVLKYQTDLLKSDSDDDGLKDGMEVLRYHTDPLRSDTDGDDLNDGTEVLKYDSDPLRVDTDGDGVTDGEEAILFKTNLLNVDSDSGTVADGMEARRGTNPLDSRDDISESPRVGLSLDLFKPMVLEGVAFKGSTSEMASQSYYVLEQAYTTLEQNPSIEVEIHGHTDNVGSPSENLRLSLARAEAVKEYLVRKGVAANRMRCRAFASTRPRASNETSEGRQLNRRIEFVRTK